MSWGWIGVDLDGTCAFYDSWKGPEHIGEPIPLMVNRIKQWLAEGKEVRIMTARVSHLYLPGSPDHLKEDATKAEKAIKEWCRKHIGQELPVTAVKDFAMLELWDDRAVGVVMNTGETIIVTSSIP